ncbi:hypothetical protein GJR96_04810 [Haloferax sp. MBLA0076]|uniref:Uncharacterized protein n=1 Tax=Haloferax litoreum TaxID=2666140 RepID=A0A6A8GHS8_9EURY|nr:MULTISPECIES: hypothetical protein [Haloferax]KAB1192797.1 hypothetical protein Hfx1148_04800 [Haloferax sp. CBA1148]MRX21280.1 hypothetical protein [Haloferax litoreum]
MNRRHFLASTGTIATTAIAGCSALSNFAKKLNVTIINRDEERRFVWVEILRLNADELDDATVFDGEIQVPAASDTDASVVKRDDIAESRPYIVRVDIHNVRRRIAPYHFYPDCVGEDGPEERLYIDISTVDDGRTHVEFNQNGC